MTTVLVTGSSGFIGRRVVEVLDAAGFEVRPFDRRQGENLCDPVALAQAVGGVDAVCHQAAKVGMGIDPGDTVSYVADNDLGTASLLEGLWRSGFRGRLVLASSMVVYGESGYCCSLPECEQVNVPTRPAPRSVPDLERGRFDPRCGSCGRPLQWQLVDESAALDPRSTYAASKLAQEHLSAVWARQTGASVVALRYHNVYGPGLPRNTPYAGVAAMFMSSIERGEPPRVFEDGAQMRDFVHVDDVARANVLALTIDAVRGGDFEPLNVCSGRPVSVLEIAQAMANASGGPQPVVTGEYRLGDVRHIVASGARAARLGFVASVGLEDGLGQLVA